MYMYYDIWNMIKMVYISKSMETATKLIGSGKNGRMDMYL